MPAPLSVEIGGQIVERHVHQVWAVDAKEHIKGFQAERRHYRTIANMTMTYRKREGENLVSR